MRGWKALLHRIRNPLVLSALLDGNAPPELLGNELTAEEWLSDPLNIALRVKDDLGIFEHQGDHIFECHAFCASRGRAAMDNTRLAISAMFETYGARSIHAEVPLGPNHRRTLMFARRMGFRPVRQIGGAMLCIYKREQPVAFDCGIRASIAR